MAKTWQHLKGVSDLSDENSQGAEIARMADQHAAEVAKGLTPAERAQRKAQSRESNVRNGEGAIQGKSDFFFSN